MGEGEVGAVVCVSVTDYRTLDRFFASKETHHCKNRYVYESKQKVEKSLIYFVT